jgi:hypothetical protein
VENDDLVGLGMRERGREGGWKGGRECLGIDIDVRRHDSQVRVRVIPPAPPSISDSVLDVRSLSLAKHTLQAGTTSSSSPDNARGLPHLV